MTLKQLEAFFWAARCASFSVAAERLFLSVSSLSKRVAELEHSLGCELFDRRRHRATLTEEGEKLLPRAHALLRQAEETREAMMGPVQALQGRCRFGVGNLIAQTWLTKLVANACRSHPGLRLSAHVEVGQRLQHGIDAGDLDCIVCAGVSSNRAIASQPVAQVDYFWAVAPALVPEGKEVGPALLSRLPLICLPPGAGLALVVDRWMAGRDILPQRLECNDWAVLVGLVVEGFGIGLLPGPWAHALAGRGKVVLLKSDLPLDPLPYSFMYRRDDTRPLIRGMLEIVRQSIDFSAASYLGDIHP